MKTLTLAAALGLGLAGAALAEGDAANGETLFNRQCTACHVVADDAGNVLAGRAGKVGPNLFALSGRTVASVDGFSYGAAILAVNATGMVWDEAQFLAYVADPTGWLRTVLNDGSARSKMAFKVTDPAVAADIWAYLATFSH